VTVDLWVTFLLLESVLPAPKKTQSFLNTQRSATKLCIHIRAGTRENWFQQHEQEQLECLFGTRLTTTTFDF